ncbi:MAG TPA: tetratricopeptide repeat protein, partial [Terriglobales bacterium]|nr:tetratricopeptide repeat protein [Terriglobales bacterium]
ESAQVGAKVASNTEGTRLYAEGLDKLRSFDALGARDLLQKAVMADPKNALFHSSLAQSWSKLGYDLNAQAEAKKAFELSSHASRADQLVVEGYYRELAGNFPAAIEIYRTLWNFFPDDLQYGLRLAAVQIEAGKGKDALGSVARMRGLPAPEDQDPRIDLAEAEAAESISDFKRTVQASAAAAAKAERQGSRLLLADALRQQGYAYQRLGRPADAIAAYQKAHSLWAAAGDNYGVATASHMIALAEYYRGNFDASQRSFEDALAVFRRIGAQEGIASCSHNYAMLLHDEGKLEDAKKYLEAALRIQRSQNDERGVAADLDDLGNVLLGMGDLDRAADLKREAVLQFHSLGNGMGEAIARGNLGNVLLAQGKLNAANQEFEKALHLKQQIGFKQGLIACWMDLASVLLARDRAGEARDMALRGLTLSQQLGNEFDSALSRLQLAQISLEQGRAAEAESLARSAAAVFDKRRVADSGAMAYAALSRALLEQGDAKEAQAASSRALSLSQEGGDRQGRFEALLAGAAIAAKAGQTAEAERQLQAVYFESRRRGYMGYELQARLRLGELEVKAGHGAGRNQLIEVQREAERQGFLLMARQAGSALQKRTSPM